MKKIVGKRECAVALLMVLLMAILCAAPVRADNGAAGTGGSAPGPATLKALVQNASALFKPVMEASRITIVVEGDAAFQGGAAKLEEQFTNLLSNALVHAPAGTAMKVSYEGAARRLLLWVENSSISYSVRRECVDSLGNSFLMETRSGRGTLYVITP